MLLTSTQNGVDKPRNQNVLVLWVRRYLPFWSSLLSQARFLLCFLRPFCPVLRAPLFSVTYTRGIKSSTDDVVTNSGQILHTPSPDHDDRVFLEVMSFARNVGCHFDSVCQTNARDLPQRGVGFLGSRRVNTRADSSPLRAALQRGSLALPSRLFSAPPYELVYCRQSVLLTRSRSESAKPANLTKKYLIVKRSAHLRSNHLGFSPHLLNLLHNLLHRFFFYNHLFLRHHDQISEFC